LAHLSLVYSTAEDHCEAELWLKYSAKIGDDGRRRGGLWFEISRVKSVKVRGRRVEDRFEWCEIRGKFDINCIVSAAF
jgi:hypothetical protein